MKKRTKFVKEKGITLIALVITIIVLLILVAVSIATLTGQNGILSRADEAVNLTGEATAREKVEVEVLGSYRQDGNIDLDKLNDNLENVEGLTEGHPIDKLPATVVVDGYDVTIDKEGNVTVDDSEQGGVETIVDGVKIPNGFYHVERTTVTGGLVISDKEGDDLNNSKGGNQYVWIPVDGILGEDGSIYDVRGNNGEKKILLGRYEFDESGIPSEYAGSYREENVKDTEKLLNYGNEIAKDIKGFIDSVRKNGGYYIARFEASQGLDNKVESKYNKAVWNLTQPNSATSCRGLYEGVNSDLMNSYAWDTAILFIQKYGQDNYSRQSSLNKSLQNTGKSGDIQLNIYDMASNCYEWTTETSNDSNSPCVDRGDGYGSTAYTSNRFCDSENYSFRDYSFRSLLYL